MKRSGAPNTGTKTRSSTPAVLAQVPEQIDRLVLAEDFRAPSKTQDPERSAEQEMVLQVELDEAARRPGEAELVAQRVASFVVAQRRSSAEAEAADRCSRRRGSSARESSG